jgi:LCP family protein required for cell wall assembly
MTPAKSRIKPWVWIGLLSLLAGLLVGWLVIGWWLWPVQWTGALPADLGPADTEKYFDLVAESYLLNQDSKLAEQRLASFPASKQKALLEDVKNRLAHRLEYTDNYLMLGADQRPGWESWRTDSIMVVAIDPKTEQVGIISIPRDLYVDIPGYGQERINVVDYVGEKKKYPGGGPALAARVISDTLGIPIQHHVRIQMDGLVRLVDALGGVDVTLDCPLYERTPEESAPKGYIEWSLPAGTVHLNGDAAKKFATYRYVTTDFGRTQRQQQLIWAIRNRALQGNIIARLPELWKAMSDVFTTDLTLVDAIKLANVGIKLKPSNVHGLVFSPSVMKDFLTDQGAEVLVVKDKAALDKAKEELFFRKTLEELGKSEAGKPKQCPPPPKP